jgi:pimeloyl-ACP methyl ester carboxylesterase
MQKISLKNNTTSVLNTSVLNQMMTWTKRLIIFAMCLAVATFGFAQDETKGNYAMVNGLELYYEIRGTGEPIVVLHGAFMTINTMGNFVSELAKTRQVIAVELQAHGHTGDIDRPLSYEAMADDVAVLLEQLQLKQADIFGYSMGAGVALQVAVRHPEVVRKLVLASVYTHPDGYYPEVLESTAQLTPEMFAGSPIIEEYQQIAPDPENFPTLVNKIKELDTAFSGWPSEAIQTIRAPTLLVIGDSDVVRPEHAVEMFRLLGGGVPGDLMGLPNAQLAVLPGTTHITVMERAEWLVSMMTPFLESPMTQ